MPILVIDLYVHNSGRVRGSEGECGKKVGKGEGEWENKNKIRK
jgi:hypothetical protein